MIRADKTIGRLPEMITMDLPDNLERIQPRYTKRWRMPPNTVKVDRTTKWENPFIPGKENPFTPGSMVKDCRHAYF